MAVLRSVVIGSSWHGRYWVRWGDAEVEAGFQPNVLAAARSTEDLLENLAGLVRELGRFPVRGEIRLKARRDSEFPSHNTYGKFGGKRALAHHLEKFCRDRGEDDLADLCASAAKTGETEDAEAASEKADDSELGYVYLLKPGVSTRSAAPTRWAAANATLPSNCPKRRSSSTRSRPTTPLESRDTGTSVSMTAARTASGSNSPPRVWRPFRRRKFM